MATKETERTVAPPLPLSLSLSLSVSLPSFSLSLSLSLRGNETPVSRLFKSSPLSPAWRLQWKSFRGPGVVKWGTKGGG